MSLLNLNVKEFLKIRKNGLTITLQLNIIHVI